LGLYPGTHHAHTSAGTWLGVYGSAVVFALVARAFWRNRKDFLELDEAAKGSISAGPVSLGLARKLGRFGRDLPRTVVVWVN
jgi:hypothetical protein